MDKKIIVKIPKENVNDEFYTLIELNVNSGDQIKKGTLIGVFETSKASFDIFAEMDGYIFFNAIINDNIPVGKPFCIITEDSKLESNDKALLQGSNSSSTTMKDKEKKVSKDAQNLIKKYAIDINQINNDGLIKKSDVEKYLQQSNEKFEYDSNFDDVKISPDKNNILIMGAGGHAKMIIDIINADKTYNIVGIVDASSMIKSNSTIINDVMGIPVICDDSKLNKLFEMGVDYAVNAVGFIESPKPRENVFKLLKKLGYKVPNIIHQTAVIEPSVKLGEGNHIFANALIGSNSIIGNNCIINSSSVLTHDIMINNNVHITPGALLAGYVTIGFATIIGMGATVYFKVKIGSNVKIYNGCNIIEDIPDGSIVRK